tara:strand:+ start:2129 stop:2254 length:126 start_codon:yes stop_codon:yes gene_type:complete
MTLSTQVLKNAKTLEDIKVSDQILLLEQRIELLELQALISK